MGDSEKLDLILQRLDGIENAIVHVNRRLTIIEGDVHQLNLKMDDLRGWTMLDKKDNPFIKPATRAIA